MQEKVDPIVTPLLLEKGLQMLEAFEGELITGFEGRSSELGTPSTYR